MYVNMSARLKGNRVTARLQSSAQEIQIDLGILDTVGVAPRGNANHGGSGPKGAA
jgi:hypothetical protein